MRETVMFSALGQKSGCFDLSSTWATRCWTFDKSICVDMKAFPMCVAVKTWTKERRTLLQTDSESLNISFVEKLLIVCLDPRTKAKLWMLNWTSAEPHRSRSSPWFIVFFLSAAAQWEETSQVWSELQENTTGDTAHLWEESTAACRSVRLTDVFTGNLALLWFAEWIWWLKVYKAEMSLRLILKECSADSLLKAGNSF